uniref:Poly [ADP-ribose] polymerase n=1 Tax=Anisakis simplex TaxID=6269 RepID=A0A0M3K9K2_ANISI
LFSDDDCHVWEFIDAKRRWKSFDSESTKKLHRAYKEGISDIGISLDGIEFTVDLDASLMKSEDGTKEYKVREFHQCTYGIWIKGEDEARNDSNDEYLRCWDMIIRRDVSKAEPAMSASPAPSAATTRSMIKRKAPSPSDSGASDAGTAQQTSTTAVKKSKTTATTKEEPESKKASTSKKASGPKKSEPKSDGKSQMRKMLLKGGAAVDPECIEKVGVAHVYTEGKDIYDAMLNQVYTERNNNKYYIIQLLEDDTEKRYSVWLRWGRVGYKSGKMTGYGQCACFQGQTNLVGCGNDLEKAKKLFCQKFSDKTHNDWSERKKFKKVSGKYDYLPADYSKLLEEKKKEAESGDGDSVDKPAIPESKLDECVQKLLKLICNIRAMEETVMELEYDATKAPLGKVTEQQIKAGYAALKRIENMKQPPLIKTSEQLKAEISLLEALSEIEVAIKQLNKGDSQVAVNPLDSHYANMKRDIEVIQADDNRYKMVNDYLMNTHASTHSQYKMKLRHLFALSRAGESEQFMSNLGNRMLLWHGSRLTNWYGILSQGLRIAPPEAPSTGYMFGKGVYFADMSSKSANYCFPQKSKPGLLVLAEVALGNVNELWAADYNADKLPPGKHSVKGMGSVGPDPSGAITLENGCVVPAGKPVELNKRSGCSLNYNEYIVYNTNQILIRYLVEVDFVFNF